MAAMWRSVFREGLFEGKVAIVTGGATGLGKAIAAELLSLGSKVVIASRNEERLRKAVDELETCIKPSSSAEVKVIPCNIRKEEQVKDLMSKTLSQYGKIDFLVNNGGGQFRAPISEMSLKGWNAVIETNLTGTFLCCREAYRQYMCNNGGAIVNMLIDMWKGYPMMAHSAAARAGIHNLTMSLAVEWIASGVRINSIAPGVIFSETAAANYPDKTLFERLESGIPPKRCGNPNEVSGVVSFLLSPAASYITGSTIKIDGGSSFTLYSMELPEHNGLPTREELDSDDSYSTKSKL